MSIRKYIRKVTTDFNKRQEDVLLGTKPNHSGLRYTGIEADTLVNQWLMTG